MIRLIVVGALLLLFSAMGFQRRRKALARLEENIRTLRTLAVRAVTYKPTTDPVTGLDRATDELKKLGCTLLGDMIEESQAAKLPTRWFVDAERTTFGWVGIAPTAFGPAEVALLMSGGERAAITLCSPRAAPGLAQPPHVDRVVREGFLDLAAALAAHKQRVPTDAKKIDSLDAALATVEDVRARTATWREAQPPAELLDSDLRSVLGRHYDKLGKTLAKRLAAEIPEARAL